MNLPLKKKDSTQNTTIVNVKKIVNNNNYKINLQDYKLNLEKCKLDITKNDKNNEAAKKQVTKVNIFKNPVKDPKKLILKETSVGSLDKSLIKPINVTPKMENKNNQLMVDIYSKLVTEYK